MSSSCGARVAANPVSPSLPSSQGHDEAPTSTGCVVLVPERVGAGPLALRLFDALLHEPPTIVALREQPVVHATHNPNVRRGGTSGFWKRAASMTSSSRLLFDRAASSNSSAFLLGEHRSEQLDRAEVKLARL
jgi:hypothetical protein